MSTPFMKGLGQKILAARKEIPAHLVLRGANVLNVFSGEIQPVDVAVYDGMIVGLGSGYRGLKEVNLRGRWIIPGLIDGHLHIESTMLRPSELARALLVCGTTTIVVDPHEIANVMGLEGIRFMLQDGRSIPFDIYYLAPSCVPATRLETSGAVLKAQDLAELKTEDRVLGLGEVMNFPGVLAGDEEVLEKIALFKNQVLDGHAPSLRGDDLQAYLSTGIRSDHETTNRAEGMEKVAAGMMLMIREGSTAKNLDELLPLVKPETARRFCLVSDDLHPEDIEKRGHLNFAIRKAMELGLDPLTAVRLVTLNPAEYFGLKDRGAVASGYVADLVVLNDLEKCEVAMVYKNGRLVVNEGEIFDFPEVPIQSCFRHPKPLHIAPLHPEDFQIPRLGDRARVIEVIPGQILTGSLCEKPESHDGYLVSSVQSDILKLCVVERHRATGRIGLGLVRGFGLKRGAMASSVAHDSHNVIVVGVRDEEIKRAVEEVVNMGGGLAVVCGEEVLARTPLEIAGLMTVQSIKPLVRQLNDVNQAAGSLGCKLEKPFMALSFLALPVIPHLKLTDLGLVDVNRSRIVPLFAEESEREFKP